METIGREASERYTVTLIRVIADSYLSVIHVTILVSYRSVSILCIKLYGIVGYQHLWG